MVEIKASAVKELRGKTGCGLMECKNALKDSGGDMQGAIEGLRKKGLASAAKKSGRSTSEGLIYSYIHAGSKIGVLLEINCETDFVARTDDYQNLSKDICMQIAAANPQYVSREEIPEEIIAKEKEIIMAQVGDKPQNILDKIVAGKIEKGFYAQVCLLDQPFVKDNDKSINDIIVEAVAKLGENIQVRRFTCYRLGEALD